MDVFLQSTGFLACILLLIGSVIGLVYLVCMVIDTKADLARETENRRAEYIHLSDLYLGLRHRLLKLERPETKTNA